MVNLHNWVPYIVAFIVCLQLILFIMNLMRMRVFRQIFRDDDSWDITKDSVGFVSGIVGSGNNVFESIKESINKYLKNSAGSVIDFHLLKDSVERNCESVEEEISAQTPVPLYCGLAGTMIGVILGLGSLLYNKSIYALIGSAGGEAFSPEEVNKLMQDVADGINALLTGVAWAMVASIFGLVLTTINSLLFKGCKLEAEKGKNEFLTWMQAKLLPELPDNTTEALTRLVNNLNEFNNTFSHNTSDLRDALKDVNKSYAIQADIIKAVHDMDVMKMAKANVNVLKELKECTDKLEEFNDYLNSIHGYTDAIQRFNSQFHRESERLHILEEIRDFFARNKAEIAMRVADEDDTLRKALDNLHDTSTNAVGQLEVALTKQSNKFIDFNEQMCNDYTRKLQQWPQLESQLAQVTTLPKKLDDIALRMENSNNAVAHRINEMTKTLKKNDKERADGKVIVPNVSLLPRWMRWLLILCVIIITAVAVFVGIKTYYDMNTENEEFQQAELVEATTGENNNSAQYPPAAEQDSVQASQEPINE